MQERPCKVIVTSPKYQWVATSRLDPDVPVFCVLIGKRSSRPRDRKVETDPEAALRRECAELDAVALFFEKDGAAWKVAPVEKLGTPPYQVCSLTAANYLNKVRAFATDAEQSAFLEEVGIAIDDDFVGC